MRAWVGLVLALGLSPAPASAASPNDTFQGVINATPWTSQRWLTGPKLQQLFQTAHDAIAGVQVGATTGDFGTLTAKNFQSTDVSTPFTDLFTSIPDNGTYLSAGMPYSIASTGGHAPGDSLRTANYFRCTSLIDYRTQETCGFVDMTANKGGTNSWVGGKTYPAGTILSYGGNTYTTANGGTSGVASPPTNTSGTSTDGTITWTYVTDGINNGKEAWTIQATLAPAASGNGGVGNTWAQASALTIKKGAFPAVSGGFATLAELDIANNDRDCPPATAGACQTYGLFIEGLSTPFTNTIGVHLGGTGNANYYFHWGLYIGPNFSKDIGIFENSGDPVGIQTGGTRSGAAISWFDTSTGAKAANLSGTYSGAIIDTSSAGGTALNAFVASVGKSVTWTGGALTGSLQYSSAVDAFAFSRNGVNLAFIGPGGLNVLSGGLSIANLPTSPPSGTKAGGLCVDTNKGVYQC